LFVSDVDECEMNTCDQLCTNFVGSYNCSCYSGYRLENDTKCVAEGQLWWRLVHLYTMCLFCY